MLRKNRLFTPGPTPLLPAAQTAMASFTAHHRTADFRALFQRVLADMKEFIGTKNDVLVLACSGTGVMEASVSNLTSPGDKVLVLTAGKFGERWTGLAKAFGCNVGCDFRALRCNILTERHSREAYSRRARGIRAGHGKFHWRAPRRAKHCEDRARER